MVALTVASTAATETLPPFKLVGVPVVPPRYGVPAPSWLGARGFVPGAPVKVAVLPGAMAAREPGATWVLTLRDGGKREATVGTLRVGDAHPKDGETFLAEGTLTLPAWPEGTYSLTVAGPHATGLAPVPVVLSSRYAPAHRAALHALDAARAAAPRLPDVARTISLPSLEMLLDDADAVWSDITEPDRDLRFVLAQLETVRTFAERLARGDDPYEGLTGILYKAYRAEADGTLQPYGVRIPKTSAADGGARAPLWPLLVDLHGAWANHRLDMRRIFGRSNRPEESDHEASRNELPLPETDMIVATAYGRGEFFGYDGLGEEDVLRVIRDVRRAYPVDPERIYLTGYSMGGGGTWSIGLRHPDLFAALVPVCAPVDGVDFQHRAPALRALDDAAVHAATSAAALAENALGLKVIFFHGERDPSVPVANAHVMVERFRALGYLGKNVTYHELAGVGHEAWEPAYADGRIFRELAGVKRNPFPRRVHHRTYSARYGENAWLRIDALARGGDAVVDGVQDGHGRFEVGTTNVAGLTLRWEERFLAKGTPLVVALDGEPVFSGVASSPLSFARRAEPGQKGPRWVRVMTPVIHPVPDHPPAGLFGKSLPRSEAHLYVYGTRGAPAVTAAARALAETLADFGEGSKFRAPVRADVDVRPDDLRDRSLVLVGGARNNALTARYASAFPLRDGAEALVAGTSLVADADRAYRLVVPRPDAATHFLLVLGGDTVGALGHLRHWLVEDGHVFGRMPETNTDYLVLDGGGQALKVGAFRDDWTIP